jgi:starvation-inducible DNA-binding protein
VPALREFRTRIDLAPSTRKPMIALLNQELADLSDLASQVKEAHWNVKGMQFIALHELFDRLVADLLPFIDDVAERITALGGFARGTVRKAAAATRLAELKETKLEGRALVEALAASYAHVAATARAAIDTASKANDADTADLFTEISRGLDKSLWFLEAHLQ